MEKTEKTAFFNVQGLCKSYTTSSTSIAVLKDVSLSLSRGEFLSIVGESGSGKSTLLQILGTLDDADQGSIHLNDVEILGLGASARAVLRNKQLGFIYQAHHLIPELTAIENIMLPLMIRGDEKKSIRNRALSLLERMKLTDRADHVPAHLSGGEAQRVAVARALATKPRLLLADEPTGNLDEATARSVFQALRELCQEEQAAVIMVTHSSALAQATDRTVRLHHGSLQPQD
ncbi:MAG: ABC transporter ATP-binding protein [Mariprofundaceae bacterium]|nr:ABC transporter ATP-binding protein [Mariprofundaceae bacterium]